MNDSTSTTNTGSAVGSKLSSMRFMRFLAAGGIAAGVNVASRWLLDHWFSYSTAILLAYLLGMITAFVLSKRFVFEQSRLNTRTEFARFTIINIAAVIQVWGVSLLLGDVVLPRLGITRHAHDIAHLFGVAVPIVTSYWGHRHFSFSQSSESDKI